MSTVVMTNYQRLADEAARVLAERDKATKIRIQVGSATCENASGADGVLAEFRKHLASSGRTDIELRQTGCTGRCSCEPIVGVIIPGQMPVKYEKVDRELAHEIFKSHILGGQPVVNRILDHDRDTLPQYELLFCGGGRCGRGAERPFSEIFLEKLDQAKIGQERARVVTAGCFGLCRAEELSKVTHVLVRPTKTLYRLSDPADLDEIIESHIRGGKPVERLRLKGHTISQRFFDMYGDVAFFNRQSRVALRNSGIVDPESLYEYMHYKGFGPLARVLEKGSPQWVIEEVTRSKLRGRGGAGYPTGKKWGLGAASPEKTR